MAQLLDNIERPRGRVFAGLVKDMREALICPVLIGSGDRANGVGRLLKFIRHEAPGIAETRTRLGVKLGNEALAQVMKTFHTAHAGKLSVVRVLNGTVAEGTELIGPNGGAGLVSGVLRINGQQGV